MPLTWLCFKRLLFYGFSNFGEFLMKTFPISYWRAAAFALMLTIAFYCSPAGEPVTAFFILLSGVLSPLVARVGTHATCAAKSAGPLSRSLQADMATDPLPPSEIRTLYVGNLPYRANEAAIRKLFSTYGQVLSVRLVKDKETGKRRGYGFVEMSVTAAEAAVSALNESEYLQRTLKVREANEKKDPTEVGDHQD